MFDPNLSTLEEMEATLERQLCAIRAAINAMKARQFESRDIEAEPDLSEVTRGKAGRTAFVMSSHAIPATDPDSAPLDFKPFAECTLPPDMNRGGGGLRSDI